MSTDRPYQSSLREERAAETRTRIRRAAAELFGAEGFQNITIARIANAAGVATPTVYAVFGSKAGIVAAMLEELEENADARSMANDVLGADDPYAQIRAFAEWLRRLYEGGASIIRAAVAAAEDEAVKELYLRGDGARRDGTRRLVGLWSERGQLRTGLDPADAAEELWLVTSVENYLFATDRLEWDGDRYQAWLGGLIERQFLA